MDYCFSKNKDKKYIYEFISPIIIEESFIIEEQNYYIEYISEELFEQIKFIINDFMKSLGERGIANFLEKQLKEIINKIVIYPEIIDNNLYCKTLVISEQELSSINMGILLDFLEDEFINGFGNKLSNVDIITEVNDKQYYDKIHKYLKINNLLYTVRLNFDNYNKFFIKKI